MQLQWKICGFTPLPVRFIPWFALILTGYLAAVQMMKKVYTPL